MMECSRKDQRKKRKQQTRKKGEKEEGERESGGGWQLGIILSPTDHKNILTLFADFFSFFSFAASPQLSVSAKCVLVRK